ncbi:MAG: thioesterase [Treponema sp.]|nr:thioesterase [Treponema sp.]
MNNYFDKTFELRYFDMNKYGEASPTTILTLLEETAAEHSYNINHSLYSLEQQNIGWVLISGTIDMTRYPKYKETIVIRTWVSKYTLVKGYRENIIYDASGVVIGKAKGVWVFYDIEKKRPVPIFNEIKSKWGMDAHISQEVDLGIIQVINGGEHQCEYLVYKSDVDSNKHVNNIRYFHWLIESLPEEVLQDYFLKRITAQFFAEAKYEEKIRVFSKSEMEKKIFMHTMRSNINNKLLAAAHTQWERKAKSA